MIRALTDNTAKMSPLLDANYSCPCVHQQRNTYMFVSLNSVCFSLFKALQKYSSQDEECLGETGLFLPFECILVFFPKDLIRP